MRWGVAPSLSSWCLTFRASFRVWGPSRGWWLALSSWDCVWLVLGLVLPSPGENWPFLLVVGFAIPSWSGRLALLGVGVGTYFTLRLGDLMVGLPLPSWVGAWPFLLGVAVWSLPFCLVVVVASSFLLWGFALPFWRGCWPFSEVAPFVLWSGKVGASFSGLTLVQLRVGVRPAFSGCGYWPLSPQKKEENI